MLLFYSPPIVLRSLHPLPPCPLRSCEAMRVAAPHLCLTSEPQSGYGPIVYTVEIPSDRVAPYRYVDSLRDGQPRVYAVPHSVLGEYSFARDDFEAITGRSWNRWTVAVLDRRGGAPPRIGEWALLWASRDGIATVRPHERDGDRYLSVEVALSSEFDPARDYIVIERHSEYERAAPSSANRGVKETWELRVLAGASPAWVSYPALWQTFVADPAVTDSAADYLKRELPELVRQIEVARSRGSREVKATTWQRVADEASAILQCRYGDPVKIGTLPSHSWTAVHAMPIRIAKRVSQQLPFAPWEPPRREPEYQDPDASGRVLLANLYGPYPRRGPGVDHKPQERAIAGLEGELALRRG